MVRSETLLTAIVTLSLRRPHFSCKEARPEGLAGTESPDSYESVPTHAQECISTGEGKKNGIMKKKTLRLFLTTHGTIRGIGTIFLRCLRGGI